ncbi:MAG: hypothetical protein PHQ11_11675 [Paludibacter sp.]|nr:hypothetical protein [Paludibacter sp.]MDD4429172.1 hypothetical protein [Paludibacter sp.]
MSYTQTLLEDRLKELEKLAPHRIKGLEMLRTMKKVRVDSNTVILKKVK